MKEIQGAIIDAIDKMHNYITEKTKASENKIKTDIALANTTSNLSKAYISSVALQYKIETARENNKKVLKEVK